MEPRRRVTSIEQLTLLVEYLDKHEDLALGRVRSKEARALSSRLWRECSLVLNREGPARTGKEWAKVWNDLKCRVRAKLVGINASQQATGGVPSNSVPLTPLEDKIAIILARNVRPMPKVRHDPLALQNDPNNEENSVELIVERLKDPLDSDIKFEPAVHDASESAASESSVAALEDDTSTPSITGHVPPSPGPGDWKRLRRARQRARRAATKLATVPVSPPPPPAQTCRTASDDSVAMLLKIENIRAEAALLNAQASKSIAEGFKLLAESIDRFTRQYARSQQEQGNLTNGS